MTDFPIIFSSEMIRALLDGRKTMTRRLAWRHPITLKAKLTEAQTQRLTAQFADSKSRFNPNREVPTRVSTPWQRVQPGDRLWARENLASKRARNIVSGKPLASGLLQACYAADDEDVLNHQGFNIVPWWRQPAGHLPCIHMPRWASRLTLIVTATKVEPLQAITEDDARAEGPEPRICGTGADGKPIRSYRTGFVYLWSSLHGTESWLNNPEVVAVSFRAIRANIDSPEAKAA